MSSMPFRTSALLLVAASLTACVEAADAPLGGDASSSDRDLGFGELGREDPDGSAPDTTAEPDAGEGSDDAAAPDGDDAAGTDAATGDTDAQDSSDDVAVIPVPCGVDGQCAPGRVCVDDLCQVILCVPAATECVDDATVRGCNETGIAWTRVDCTDGATCPEGTCACRDGACVRIEECAPGTLRCGGDVVEECAATGDYFVRATDCAEDALVCLGGACTCPDPLTACADDCVDTSTDTKHCGECGVECAGTEVCRGGACACDAPFEICDGVCSDLDTDPRSCGLCGVLCNADQGCSEGVCTCPGTESDCGDFCANLATDSASCGACGRACPSDQTCRAGACTCVSAGLTPCDDGCVNTRTNRQHCGACGIECPTSQSCVDSRCECTAAGLTACGTSCVNLNADRNNCGRCGNTCSGICSAGVCEDPACTCEFPLVWCPLGGVCSNPDGCCAPLGFACLLFALEPCTPP